MKSLRIQNLRSLLDTGDVELRPFTVLLGQNSSGKSTFVRLFPLLRQSAEVKTLDDILWVGPYVDFGGFGEALCTEAETQRISFTFKLVLPFDSLKLNQPVNTQDLNRKKVTIKKAIPCEFTLSQVNRNQGSASSICSMYDIELFGVKSSFTVNEKLSIVSLNIGGRDITEVARNNARLLRLDGLLPRLHLFGIGSENANPIVDELLGMLRPWIDESISDDVIRSAFQYLDISSQEAMLVKLTEMEFGSKWLRHCKEWSIESAEFRKVYECIFILKYDSVFEFIGEYLTGLFRKVKYITPIRASAERFYRLQGLAVDELDPNGANLAPYLQSLSDVEAASFSNWTSVNLGFSVQTEATASHVSVILCHDDSGTRFKLSDVGFGFSQVLPILIHLWRTVETESTQTDRVRRAWGGDEMLPNVILIEQPELHLHPRLQAALTDLLIRTISKARVEGVDLRIVLETHSETVVNRFGRAIEKGDFGLTHSDVGIYVFDKPVHSKVTDVTLAEFGPEGELSNWPLDFFEPVSLSFANRTSDTPSEAGKAVPPEA
jgi:predicted ATPase